jgi:S-adenosylmethionine decarboxylase
MGALRRDEMGHGRHVKVVGYGAVTLVGAVVVVRDFLKELVSTLGMRALGEPVMHDVELDLSKLNVEPFEDEGGVTGVAVLSTSHCAIHTWPARDGFFVLDVYSCRDFDPTAVAEALTTKLGVRKLRMTDVTSALEPPP